MDQTRYQQWKQSWLTCGRVLLTLTVLTILTVVLYLASQNVNYIKNLDHPTEGVRYRRDVNDIRIERTNQIDPENKSMLPSHQAWSSNSYVKSQPKNPPNRSLDASITTSTKKADKNFPSHEHDKSQRIDGITYHSDSSQTVDGGMERHGIKNVLHDKQKMKRKRKKFVSNLSSRNISDIKLPKSSIRALTNVTDVNGLEIFSPDMVMDENNVVGERVVRHKKDQLIIREDQGVVIVRKYTCIPCQRVPGQRTSIKIRPRYRGMFLRHVCC